ncbi:Aromatic prenyltransferase DMATS type [Penicillium waksmanii]|uniref:Aromatic prenyltransferase DMATS type n=1 Tax=Penicillium waksmanii TaxID=69791 RepID=UPI0025479CF8|nr:Aromatic prenyltransferase DMATS type [Penicillium waksmanii]KAJ5974909.1 Aromatic prenyltransferase DMATS type [Penicillium waksmanii]
MTVTVKSPTSGEIKGNGDSQNASPPFKCFAFQDHAEHAWWDKTAALLSKVLQSAQYSVEHQYLYMMLYRTVLIPRLGPHPHTWDSFITYSGVPVEFSINFQEHGPPTARIGWEPISHKSGSSADPINKATITEAIATMSELNLKGFNTRYLNHMIESLTATSEESAEVGRDHLYLLRMKNQVSFGLDLKGGEVSVKCYLYPALKSHLTGKSFRVLVNHAVHSPRWVQDVTWSKLQDIWTLGGRFKSHATIQRGLQFAQKFWQLVTLDQEKMDVGIWSYELAAGSSIFPNPKYYFILHGLNDIKNAQAIANFYEYVGWHDLAATFIDSVKGYFPNFGSGETSNLIQYVSLAYSEKTGVYLSVYYHSSL